MSAIDFEAGSLELRIAEKAEIAKGIFRFELVHPEGAELPEFTPGAHVSIRTPNREVRKYSLSNDPAEREHYVIAVKREEPGTGGSLSLTSEATVGDLVEVSYPRNDFELAANISNFLFIAGGIGITPILSMM